MTYVVLLPGGPGNTTDKHLVVDTFEYVDVTRHGKKAYDFCTEHDDWDSANTERTRLNQEPPKSWTPPTTTTPSTTATTATTTSAPGKSEGTTPTALPSTATWKPKLVKSTAPST